MQVAPLEKVNALELRIKALEDMLNQIMSAKVSVEWVGMETAEVSTTRPPAAQMQNRS